MGDSCLPHTKLDAQTLHCNLKRVAVKVSVPLDQPYSYTCVSAYLAQAPSLSGVFNRGFLQDPLPTTPYRRWRQGTFKTLFTSFESVPSTFPLLIFFSFSPLPSIPHIHKTAGTFGSGFPQQPNNLHVYANLSDPWSVCLSTGKIEQEGVHVFSGLASCLML